MSQNPGFSLRLAALAFVVLAAGCASSRPPFVSDPAASGPGAAQTPPSPKSPNWDEIDKTVQRVKEREKSKPRLVETERTVEQGFLPMSEADYTAALETARVEIRKANPKLSDGDVETEAIKRADAAKWTAEHAYSSRASSTYELKKSSDPR
jgi:hypothetical protein